MTTELNLKCADLVEIVNEFSTAAGKDITHRYYSFDFCYAHFRQTRALPKEQRDIKKSCFVLWSYLSSWGMLRGSSFLLDKNPAYLKNLVEWIYTQPESAWEIDVEDYGEKFEEIKIRLYDEVKEHILNDETHITLVSKILLGVFAIIPAYDQYFTATFRTLAKGQCGFRSVNKKSLGIIKKFYDHNKQEIDELSQTLYVRDFDGKPTRFHYSKAKIIDMYGFQLGLNKDKEEDKTKNK